MGMPVPAGAKITQPSYDQFGHSYPPISNGSSPNLVAANLVLAAAAGAAASVSLVNACDIGGSFQINSLGAGQVVGNILTITFANPLEAPPKGILINIKNTASFADTPALYTGLSAAGFTISVGTALVAGQSYYATFWVIE